MAEDLVPEYISREEIINKTAKREGHTDWKIMQISDEVHEERNAQSDIDSWTQHEKTSWYEYRLWYRLCEYILIISSCIFIDRFQLQLSRNTVSAIWNFLVIHTSLSTLMTSERSADTHNVLLLSLNRTQRTKTSRG